jgi:hypothetical protein
MNRRTLLASLPAAGIAAVTPAVATAEAVGENSLLTLGDWAAIEWTPLSDDVSESDLIGCVPTHEQVNNPGLVSMRIATRLLIKAKPEMLEMVRGLAADESGEQALCGMMDSMDGAIGMFEGMAELIKMARDRTFSAMCAHVHATEGLPS